MTYKAHLVHFSSGKNIPIGCAPLERKPKGRFQVQFLELELGQLEPGEYVIYILARDSSTKEAAYIHTSLVAK
jgi:hypothetical protein